MPSRASERQTVASRRLLAAALLVALLAGCSGTRGEAQALLGAGQTAASDPAAARSQPTRWWIYPNLAESRGLNLDTTLTFALATGTREATAITLHLFDEDGSPVGSCAPCQFDLDTGTPSVDVKLEPLVAPSGSSLWLGFALVGGPGSAGAVVLHGATRNDNGDRGDDALFTPVPILRSYVLPHVLENAFGAGSSLIQDQFTFDTSVFMVYTPGLAGLPAGPGASVDLFLFGPDRKPVAGDAGVCNPCTFDLGGRHRTVRVDVDSYLEPFDQGTRFGFGTIVVRGQDPDGVNIQGFVVNTHRSQFDLSVFTFEPQPLAAAQ